MNKYIPWLMIVLMTYANGIVSSKLLNDKNIKIQSLVDECIESLRILIDDYDEYNSEEDWG